MDRRYYSVIPCHRDAYPGFTCTRGAHDSGPCALKPCWWNIRAFTHRAWSK